MANVSDRPEGNSFPVPEELDGERLDKVLASVLPQSRSYLQKLLKNGCVYCTGRKVKASTRVKEGEEIFFDIPEKVVPDILPEDIPLDILYEDNDLLVVNKPKGMVVHPAPGHYTGTLVNAIMYHCGDHLSGINGVLRPGIVHRIDRDTTGSLLVCKNDLAHQSIALQLREHTIHREYRAICCGVPDQDEMIIEKPIGRDPKDRLRMAVVPDGKYALTQVHVSQRFSSHAEIRCVLKTGRTHQIRVHLSSVGFPLLGDPLYGPGRSHNSGNNKPQSYKGQILEGQCLHAEILGFMHPRTGEYIETFAPLPEYYQNLLNVL